MLNFELWWRNNVSHCKDSSATLGMTGKAEPCNYMTTPPSRLRVPPPNRSPYPLSLRDISLHCRESPLTRASVKWWQRGALHFKSFLAAIRHRTSLPHHRHSNLPPQKIRLTDNHQMRFHKSHQNQQYSLCRCHPHHLLLQKCRF